MSEAAFWVRMPLPFRLNHVNIYLIEDGDGWAVLDAEIGNDTTRAIWMAVAGLAMWLDCTPRGQPAPTKCFQHVSFTFQ